MPRESQSIPSSQLEAERQLLSSLIQRDAESNGPLKAIVSAYLELSPLSPLLFEKAGEQHYHHVEFSYAGQVFRLSRCISTVTTLLHHTFEVRLSIQHIGSPVIESWRSKTSFFYESGTMPFELAQRTFFFSVLKENEVLITSQSAAAHNCPKYFALSLARCTHMLTRDCLAVGLFPAGTLIKSRIFDLSSPRGTALEHNLDDSAPRTGWGSRVAKELGFTQSAKDPMVHEYLYGE